MTTDHALFFLGGLLLGAGGMALLAVTAFLLWRRAQHARQREEQRVQQDEAADLRSELLRHTVREQALHRELDRLSASASDFERFVGRVSQELHTPVQNAGGFARLLMQRHGASLPAQAGEYLQHLELSISQMRQLLDALLKLSQIGRESTRPVAVPLAQVWEAAVHVHAQRIAVLQAELLACQLPQVEGDPRLLQDLFERLLDNALKFQPPGQRPRVSLNARRLADDWHITIVDNGIGIPWGRLEAVFLPLQRLYAREEFDGAGLGLAICRKIVQHHNGQIWAEPHDGGAQIHLVLPALQNSSGSMLPDAGPPDAAP